MNLHPIFVHFPVALLSLYCLMELARFKIFMRQPYWFYLKAVFVMLGGLGALAALYTGSEAKLAVRLGQFNPAVADYNQVLRMHQNFADLTAAVFGIIAACYLFLWMNRENFSKVLSGSLKELWNGLVKMSSFLVETRFIIILAIMGLIVITITGGLGGRIAYGPSADPFLKPVLDKLLGQ